MSKLFSPLTVGSLGTLAHRVVLAPLTRMRAEEPNLVPTTLMAKYYAQRTTRGCLLISEATYISPESQAYNHAPGVFTDSQVEGWRKVTDAVHAKGGKIVCQLWHVGRIAHSSFVQHPLASALSDVWKPGVSASAVAMPHTKHLRFDGKYVKAEAPRALETGEIPRLIRDYIHAAECAKRAGFDGVELHAAHGYLIDQFLNTDSNKRTDEYGGSIEKRCRLLFEVLQALISVWGPGRVGLRLSPHGGSEFKYHDCSGADADALYSYAVAGLNNFPLAYLLLTEMRWTGRYDAKYTAGDDPMMRMALVNCEKFRSIFKGVLIGAGGFTPASAKAAIDDGHCDAVAFGRWFIANPDLVYRLRVGLPLNRYKRATFYTYGAFGYTDYPTYENVQEEDKKSLVPQERIGATLAAAKL